MRWRKWLVRGLVFSILGGCAVLGILYQRWTNPAAVKRQVIEKLETMFPGAKVTLDSARLRLLGGIVLSELRLSRKDDPNKGVFACFPTAILYPDKEQFLQGKLSLRKVELTRPRLRIVRQRDGCWNLANLVAPEKEQGLMPTLVIQHGTIRLLDRFANPEAPAVEINDVQMTVVNDPPSTVAIEATGNSALLGTVRLHGTWQRQTQQANLSLEALGVSVTPALLQRLAATAGDPAASSLHSLHLEGKADCKAKVCYRAAGAGRQESGVRSQESGGRNQNMPVARPASLSYEVHCHLTKGKLNHPLLPLPLEQVDASVLCTNQQLRLEHFSARSGPTEIQGQGQARFPAPDQDFDAKLAIRHLLICPELLNHLSEPIQNILADYHPSGLTTLNLHFGRKAGGWQSQTCTLHPEEMTAAYCKFPFPVERLHGTLEIDLLAGEVKVDLAGRASNRPVIIQGTWKGAGNNTDARLDIHAEGLPLPDDHLLHALNAVPGPDSKLPGRFASLLRSFHPVGRYDLEAHIRKSPGKEEFSNQYLATFRETSTKWDEFPYLVEKATGVLDIRPGFWEVRDCHGTHHGGDILVYVSSLPESKSPGKKGDPQKCGQGIQIDIRGKNLALDGDLQQALSPMPPLARAWKTFMPAGQMSFAAHIDRLPGQPQDLNIAVAVEGCSVEPQFFHYALSDLQGKFHYRKNQLILTNLSARHGKTIVRLNNGTIDFIPGGGLYANLNSLEVKPMSPASPKSPPISNFPDRDLIAALPEALRDACAYLNIHGPVTLKTWLIIALSGAPGIPPDIWWDGSAWLNQVELQAGIPLEKVTGWIACRGRHNGKRLKGVNGNIELDQAAVFKQPFQNVHCNLQITEEKPDVMVFTLKAPVFGGQVAGQGRVVFSSSLNYELDLSALQIKLDEFSKHNLGPNPPQLTGLAEGRLYLTGQGCNANSLEGRGRLDMPKGKLYNLPLLLDLLSFMGLRLPDRTLFSEAHTTFTIHGQRVGIEQIDLLGNAITLRGKGGVNLNGSDVQMELYVNSRSEPWFPQWMRELSREISKNILTIEMRGDLNNPRFTRHWVPLVVDPFRELTAKTSKTPN
jgi:hypothetical protein